MIHASHKNHLYQIFKWTKTATYLVDEVHERTDCCDPRRRMPVTGAGDRHHHLQWKTGVSPPDAVLWRRIDLYYYYDVDGDYLDCCCCCQWHQSQRGRTRWQASRVSMEAQQPRVPPWFLYVWKSKKFIYFILIFDSIGIDWFECATNGTFFRVEEEQGAFWTIHGFSSFYIKINIKLNWLRVVEVDVEYPLVPRFARMSVGHSMILMDHFVDCCPSPFVFP